MILVCEGFCNDGRVEAFDEFVKTAARHENINGVASVDLPDAAILLRKMFKYSKHVKCGHQWRCSTCDAIRSF